MAENYGFSTPYNAYGTSSGFGGGGGYTTEAVTTTTETVRPETRTEILEKQIVGGRDGTVYAPVVDNNVQVAGMGGDGFFGFGTGEVLTTIAPDVAPSAQGYIREEVKTITTVKEVPVALTNKMVKKFNAPQVDLNRYAFDGGNTTSTVFAKPSPICMIGAALAILGTLASLGLLFALLRSDCHKTTIWHLLIFGAALLAALFCAYVLWSARKKLKSNEQPNQTLVFAGVVIAALLACLLLAAAVYLAMYKPFAHGCASASASSSAYGGQNCTQKWSKTRKLLGWLPFLAGLSGLGFLLMAACLWKMNRLSEQVGRWLLAALLAAALLAALAALCQLHWARSRFAGSALECMNSKLLNTLVILLWVAVALILLNLWWNVLKRRSGHFLFGILWIILLFVLVSVLGLKLREMRARQFGTRADSIGSPSTVSTRCGGDCSALLDAVHQDDLRSFCPKKYLDAGEVCTKAWMTSHWELDGSPRFLNPGCCAQANSFFLWPLYIAAALAILAIFLLLAAVACNMFLADKSEYLEFTDRKFSLAEIIFAAIGLLAVLGFLAYIFFLRRRLFPLRLNPNLAGSSNVGNGYSPTWAAATDADFEPINTFKVFSGDVPAETYMPFTTTSTAPIDPRRLASVVVPDYTTFRPRLDEGILREGPDRLPVGLLSAGATQATVAQPILASLSTPAAAAVTQLPENWSDLTLPKGTQPVVTRVPLEAARSGGLVSLNQAVATFSTVPAPKGFVEGSIQLPSNATMNGVAVEATEQELLVNAIRSEVDRRGHPLWAGRQAFPMSTRNNVMTVTLNQELCRDFGYCGFRFGVLAVNGDLADFPIGTPGIGATGLRVSLFNDTNSSNDFQAFCGTPDELNALFSQLRVTPIDVKSPVTLLFNGEQLDLASIDSRCLRPSEPVTPPVLTNTGNSSPDLTNYLIKGFQQDRRCYYDNSCVSEIRCFDHSQMIICKKGFVFYPNDGATTITVPLLARDVSGGVGLYPGDSLRSNSHYAYNGRRFPLKDVRLDQGKLAFVVPRPINGDVSVHLSLTDSKGQYLPLTQTINLYPYSPSELITQDVLLLTPNGQGCIGSADPRTCFASQTRGFSTVSVQAIDSLSGKFIGKVPVSLASGLDGSRPFGSRVAGPNGIAIFPNVAYDHYMASFEGNDEYLPSRLPFTVQKPNDGNIVLNLTPRKAMTPGLIEEYIANPSLGTDRDLCLSIVSHSGRECKVNSLNKYCGYAQYIQDVMIGQEGYERIKINKFTASHYLTYYCHSSPYSGTCPALQNTCPYSGYQTPQSLIQQQQIIYQDVPQQQIIYQDVPQQQIIYQDVPQQQIIYQEVPQQQQVMYTTVPDQALLLQSNPQILADQGVPVLIQRNLAFDWDAVPQQEWHSDFRTINCFNGWGFQTIRAYRVDSTVEPNAFMCYPFYPEESFWSVANLLYRNRA